MDRTDHAQTDRTGRHFSDREILAMDVDAFESAWGGTYRQAVLLYMEVAERNRHERAATLPTERRHTLVRLEKALTELDGAVAKVSFLTSGWAWVTEPTHIARRERCLWQIARAWSQPTRPDPAAVAHLQRALARLRGTLRRLPPVNLQAIPYSTWMKPHEAPRAYRVARWEAREAAAALERLISDLPPGAEAPLGQQVLHLDQALR